jgi:hypothetical protein
VEFTGSRRNEVRFVAFRGVFYYGCRCLARGVYCDWGVDLSFSRYAGKYRLSRVYLVNARDVSIGRKDYGTRV